MLSRARSNQQVARASDWLIPSGNVQPVSRDWQAKSIPYIKFKLYINGLEKAVAGYQPPSH